MKTTDATEIQHGSTRMKPENTSPRTQGVGRRVHSPMRIPNIPMEWMDPMSWRLPSGKALAEFALQAGFLAPLMLSAPALKRRRPKLPQAPPVIVEEQRGEAPERSGTFRETR
ncbi:MAG: hypothetical protein ABSB35_06605 [Bryobacteraceae bacterium]